MKGFITKNMCIDFIQDEYCCPYCLKVYQDEDWKIFDSCCTLKRWFKRIKCECWKKFWLAVDMMSEFRSFKF